MNVDTVFVVDGLYRPFLPSPSFWRFKLGYDSCGFIHHGLRDCTS